MADFFDNENKKLLWDLMVGSRFFEGLDGAMYGRVVERFEDTMRRTKASSKTEGATLELNKRFLVAMRDEVGRLRGTVAATTSACDVAPMKSDYTSDLDRKMKAHESNMREMLVPPAPESIDFTRLEPHDASLRNLDEFAPLTHKVSTKDDPAPADETDVDALLAAKLKARERESTLYFAASRDTASFVSENTRKQIQREVMSHKQPHAAAGPADDLVDEVIGAESLVERNRETERQMSREDREAMTTTTTTTSEGARVRFDPMISLELLQSIVHEQRAIKRMLHEVVSILSRPSGCEQEQEHVRN